MREAIASLIGAVASASSYGLPDVELRGHVNLSYAAAGEDPELAYRTAREGRRAGAAPRHARIRLLPARQCGPDGDAVGDWDWASAQTTEAYESNPDDMAARMRLAEVAGLRGEDSEGEFAQLEQFLAD